MPTCTLMASTARKRDLASTDRREGNALRGRLVVTGGGGFLGSRVVSWVRRHGASDIFVPRSDRFNLVERDSCREVVQGADTVIHLAARVGGIGFNRENPGTLFFDNLMMGTQLMEEARLAGVKKFVAIGTVCAYPKLTPVPFHEDNLWDGYPEETNAPYGLAKKMQLVQAQAYRQQYGFNSIYLLPVNLYGPGDNFDPRSSHVIPALIRKIMAAKQNREKAVEVWGDGSASREFLYVEDAAEAIALATERYDWSDPVNLGAGREITIKSLVTVLCDLIGYEGQINWDTTKPNGQPRRSLDVGRAEKEFGFRSRTDFETGLRRPGGWWGWEGAARTGAIAKQRQPAPAA